ncbi:MAG: cold shock domain-containing protein, partial [Bacteroidota bacterium]
TKPDPTKKFSAKLEDISLGVPQNSRVAFDSVHRGKVKTFMEEKGYGFITNKATKESIFVHINDAYEGISENHIVDYEIGKGNKGQKAINVVRVIT